MWHSVGKDTETGKLPNISLKYKTLCTVWMWMLKAGICVNADYTGRLINSFKMV